KKGVIGVHLRPNFLEPAQTVHSCRSATIGSILAARREGTQDATPATATSKSTDPPNVSGSVGASPYSNFDNSRDTRDAPTNPTPPPTAASASPWRSTRAVTSAGRAPSATRIPISLVRWTTR